MRFSRKALACLLCGAVFLLQGCTSWQVNQLASALPSVGPEQTLAHLETITPSNRDRPQYLLDMGLLKLYTGDLQGSRQDLNEAKDIMVSLQAVSVTENLSAVTINETLRSYSGSPSDRVLVHVILALAYLLDGDVDGARVEMLQADVTMQEEADGDSLSGQTASARFLAGVIYELQGERDNAFISYNRAYNIMKARSEPIPEALQTGLLYLAKRQGRNDDYKKFSAEFKREAELQEPNQGAWFVFYHDGVVSNKGETRISVFDAEVDTMVSVVMPHYYPSNYYPTPLQLSLADKTAKTQVVENLESRAREDLEKENAKNLAAATVRAVAKYKMVQEAQSKGDLTGVIMNLATVASEQADVRSWNMLPATIQVARLTAPADQALTLASRSRTLPSLEQLTEGKFVVVLASSISERVFTYPPSNVSLPKQDVLSGPPETIEGDSHVSEPEPEPEPQPAP